MSNAATAKASPWIIEATSGSGEDLELPSPGVHPAVCIGLVDLGTHDSVYQGKAGERHKILILWELVAEKKTDGDPFCVHKDFTSSLHVKSDLRKFVEAWQARSIQDGERFDLLSLVKQRCMVSLTEGKSAKGHRFVEVASCSLPMRGLNVPEPIYPDVVYCLADVNDCLTDPPIPDFVPPLYGKKIVEEIKASKEWAKLPNF
jgi:hypothetical protein